MNLYPKETELPEYNNFKRLKLLDPDELPPVVQETGPTLSEQLESFKAKNPPDYIQNEFSKILSEIVEKSEGKFKSYKIYPEFWMGKEDNPRRRDGTYRMSLGDKPILLQGVEIGFLVRSVQYLHPSSWSGLGIPLKNEDRSQFATQNQKKRTQTQQKEGQ